MESNSQIAKKRRRFVIKEDDMAGYAFILIAMLVFFIFTIYPFFSALVTSFQKYKPLGSTFVGIENYKAAFKSSLFWKSLKNTVIYTLITVPCSTAISFAIAILIIPFKKKTQSLFKALYYIPAVVSAVVLSVVWLWIYSAAPSGIANRIITSLGIPSQNWLASSKTAMLSLILMVLLGGHGSNIIIYIAALLNIDNAYFEAAEVDGASFRQKLFLIVLPLVKPTTLFILITGVIYSFQSFITAYMMTGGGPDNNTTMVGLLIYNNAFVYGKYGVACAEAIFLTLVIATLTIIQFRVNAADVEY